MLLIFAPGIKSCNDYLVLKSPKLLNTNIINKNIYKLDTGKIFIFTNQPLQVHLGPIPNKVLNIFFELSTSYVLWLNCPRILYHILSGNENEQNIKL